MIRAPRSSSRLDLLEHVAGQKDLIGEAHRVLAPRGVLFLATPNRWSLAPESHVKVWGLGFLPRAWRAPALGFRPRDHHRQ